MKRDIALQIYAYCVCATALAVALIFFCIGVYGVVKIAAPEFTAPQWAWNNVATFQSFKTDWQKTQGAPQLTDDELKVRWEDKRQIAIMAERRGGAQMLINMIIAFIVTIPVFILHWRLARRHRE